MKDAVSNFLIAWHGGRLDYCIHAKLGTGGRGQSTMD